MRHVHSPRFAVVVLSILPAMLLFGCGVGVTIPDVATPTAQVSIGAILGSNYGGHAPIVGAHVFVLEGAPSTSGYYQPAKSLLNVVSTGQFPTAVEPAGTAVAGDNYVTSDINGDFNITGGYTCDSGDPVYLYAEGGNPETNPRTQNVVNITQIAISGTGPYTLTFTTDTTNGPTLVYQGETLVLNGFTGTWAYLNGSSQVVLGNTSLTTTAGFPRTMTLGATSASTTLPAATMLPGPTLTPGAMKAAAATQLPSRMVMGLVRREKAGDAKSCDPVQRKARCETQQLDSMATGARLRISTSSPIQT